MIDISIEEDVEKAIKEIGRRIAYDNIINEEISADYLRFDILEKKLAESRILITKLEPTAKSIIITLTSRDASVSAIKEALDAINNPSILKFDPEKISLDIDGNQADNSKEKLDFLYIKTCLLSLPFNFLKEITVKNIIERFDYDENEFIFKEFFRMLACGGKLYIEMIDSFFYYQFLNQSQQNRFDCLNDIELLNNNEKEAIENKYNFYSNEIEFNYLIKKYHTYSFYTNEVLKSYLECCGFSSVMPSVSVEDYTPGKIKIDTIKPGLSEFTAEPKKVLIKVDSRKFKDLLRFSVFIRDIHNKYNNWSLYLTSNYYEFFDNNIYLKYCSNEIPPEKFDYVILLDDPCILPDIQYKLKYLDSKKADIFFDDKNKLAAQKFLKKFGISIENNDNFIILDEKYINDFEKNEIIQKVRKDFPYLFFNENNNDVKILYSSIFFEVFDDGFGSNIENFKYKDIIYAFYSSSFYAGADFCYDLASELHIPAYEKVTKQYNYKRVNDFDIKENLFDISIIIPIFNNFKYTENCLNSIFKNHPLASFEIIVVNNGSTDATKEYLEKYSNISNVTIINNEHNLGFAKSCNQAARIAGSNYLLFLNNDTYVLKGAIDELYNSINIQELNYKDYNNDNLNSQTNDFHRKIGIAGSLLLYPDNRIQHAGVVFENRGIAYHTYKTGEIYDCKNLDYKNGVYLRRYNAVTAACIIIKRELFINLGLFDEIFINGFEDVDLCLKVRQVGFDIILNPKSMLYHYEEKTHGRKRHELENQFNFQNKWRFKFQGDDYIHNELDGLKIIYDFKSGSISYLSKNNIKQAEYEIDRLISLYDYNKALSICDEVLSVDNYNLPIYKKKVKMKKYLNLQGKDEKILLDLNQDKIYQMWIKHNEPNNDELNRQCSTKFKLNPKISIIMPVYNTPEDYLRKAIESVINQTYFNWELCITDDASTKFHIKKVLEYYKKKDKRIKIIYRTKNGHITKASNDALFIATGDYLALLDHDDELHKTALFYVVKVINDYPEAKLIYSDEDKLDINGNRIFPYFKSDYNPDLFLSQNMISHLGVYKRSIIEEVGGFREGYEGSQDYDLALRFIEKIKYYEIRHIPRVLYHWRMINGSTAINVNNKPYAVNSARRAVQEHLDRLNIKAKVVEAPLLPVYNRVIYDIELNPFISIMISIRYGYKMIKGLLESVMEKTLYKNYEIVIINMDSGDKNTIEYLNLIKKENKIKVVDYNKPFNHSAMINYAVEFAKGEVLVILNDDMKVINGDWLRELVSHAMRKDIGVAGAKVLYVDDTIKHAGVVFSSDAIQYVFRKLKKEDFGYSGKINLLQNYSVVSGGCMAVKKKLYEETKGMDENLTSELNVLDFCLKLKKLGYFNVYTPYTMLYDCGQEIKNNNNMENEHESLKKEIDYFKVKWGKDLQNDFAYNPNLDIFNKGFETTMDNIMKSGQPKEYPVIYDYNYYHYYHTSLGPIPYDRTYPQWLEFFRNIADRITKDIRPKTVLDVGCAKGFLVESLRDRGVEAFGIDISEYAIKEVRDDIKKYCQVASATEKFDNKYDLITCIEVLEHLNEEDGQKAIENICQSTDDVIFSSTPDDFVEKTHINVQPVSYWIDSFAKRGFYIDSGYNCSFLTEYAMRFRNRFSFKY